VPGKKEWGSPKVRKLKSVSKNGTASMLGMEKTREEQPQKTNPTEEGGNEKEKGCMTGGLSSEYSASNRTVGKKRESPRKRGRVCNIRGARQNAKSRQLGKERKKGS